MNYYVKIFIFFLQISLSISSIIYPCQYNNSNELILKCDLCQCLSIPTIYSISNFCYLKPLSTCFNTSTNINFHEITENIYQTEKLIEFHNFNNDLLYNEQLCLINNYSNMIFHHFNYKFSLNSIPQCLFRIKSLNFINSFVENNEFFSEKLTFYNTTFNIKNFNLTSTKMLILHMSQFLIQPFEFNSLTSLTYLMIKYTENFTLTGLFPHLSYLNFYSTNLNDKQLNKFFSQINLPDLTTLILTKNHLTMITNKFPSTIRYLDLSHNNIKSLDYYSFKSLYSLNILNLSYNSPLEIQQDTFTRIPYLEILDLTHTLPTLPFEELFLPLQKLTHLNISNNYLDTIPQLPVPYDAHIIESYDHHFPVLYIDLSHNSFDNIDFEPFLSSSTQDKYILSLNLNNNRLKTLQLSSLLFNDTKRRGPFIELDINNNPLECDCHLYETISHLFKHDLSLQQKPSIFNLSPSNPFHYYRIRRQYNSVPPTQSTNFHHKSTRIKLLHSSNLTCIDMIEPRMHRSFFELNSSNSFCSYTKTCPSTCLCCSQINCNCSIQCPHECSCRSSYDFQNNYVNCSNRQLTEIPLNTPYSTTHLYLNNNQIKSLEINLTNTTKYNIFANLIYLKKLHLHDNPWIPNFYQDLNKLQYNKHLIFLSYANDFICNRSIDLQRSLTMEDCCKYSLHQYCQQQQITHSRYTEKILFISLINQKYLFIGLILFIIIFLCILIYCIFRKKRLFDPSKNITYLSNENIEKYKQQENDNSLSYTDEDDYASIPLTISQSDKTPVIYIETTRGPPLPPPRYITSHRPISNSSTTSTSITIQSIKGPNLSSARSCLQIKLDVLVIYSINDSKYIHEYLGQQLEYLYGKRFSFYFLHRDRMLGELEWLIENSCIILLILRKPYHLKNDYMKIFSKYTKIKCFIILINTENNSRYHTSIKSREKIAKIYQTTDIYEWNSNPNSLIHEQLELYLEQNCGSASYVTD